MSAPGTGQPGHDQQHEQHPALPADAPVAVRLPGRVRARLAGLLAEPRFVSEPPASLLEHLAYARSGEWTDEIDSYGRHLALCFAWLVAIPVATVAYFAAWASARPGRFFSIVAVTLLVNTGLAAVPVIGWFIPRWATLPGLPPFSWIF
jgi:hypothetical protein